MQERRRFMRFDLAVDVKYKVSDAAIEEASQSKDFSREGIGLYIDRMLPIGAMIELEISIPGEIVPIFATGRMAWIKESDDPKAGNFLGGVELIRISPFDKSRILNYAYDRRHKITEKG